MTTQSAARGSARVDVRVLRAVVRAAQVLAHALDVLWRAPGVRAAQESRVLALRRTCAEMGRQGRALCHAHGIAVTVTGDLPRQPALLVCNHISYLDPLVIASLVPCIPVAKDDVRRWPILGRAMAALGIILVERDDSSSGAQVLRQAVHALRAGVPILIFPEGTTTRGETVLPFERGAFGMAQLARVPIVPLRIDYADREMAWVGDATFLPHYLRMAAKRESRVFVQVGRPIAVGGDDDAQALANSAHAAVMALSPS